MVGNVQTQKLSARLKQINNLLEKILHEQFGIEDRQWINAMSKIEEGFLEAVMYIAKRKEVQKTPSVLTKEEIDEILEK